MLVYLSVGWRQNLQDLFLKGWHPLGCISSIFVSNLTFPRTKYWVNTSTNRAVKNLISILRWWSSHLLHPVRSVGYTEINHLSKLPLYFENLLSTPCSNGIEQLWLFITMYQPPGVVLDPWNIIPCIPLFIHEDSNLWSMINLDWFCSFPTQHENWKTEKTNFSATSWGRVWTHNLEITVNKHDWTIAQKKATTVCLR